LKSIIGADNPCYSGILDPECPISQINFPDKLRIFTAGLVILCERSSCLKTLNDVICIADLIEKSLPQGYETLSSVRNSLAVILRIRFQRLGGTNSLDVDRSIRILQSVVNDCSPDDIVLPSAWSNLGSSLCSRYEWSSSLEDLDNAIDVAEMVAGSRPTAEGTYARHLCNLSVMYRIRHDRTDNLNDISQAIEVAETALDDMNTQPLSDYPNDRAVILANLADFLKARFNKSRAIGDFYRAVQAVKDAIKMTNDNHPNKTGYLATYSSLLSLYPKEGEEVSTKDLDESIRAAEEGLSKTPDDHPQRATYLYMLTARLREKYLLTADINVMTKIIEYHIQGYRCQNAQPSLRAQMARTAAELYFIVKPSDPGIPGHFLQHAVELLQSISPRSFRCGDQQHVLKDFEGLASDAASMILKETNGNNSRQALKVLELGRDVIAGLLLETRINFSELRQDPVHGHLGEEIESLSEQLDLAVGTVPLEDTAVSSISMTQKRREVADKLDDAFARVRQIPKFGNFLGPPTDNELLEAVAHGPIAVINVSKYSSEAFLIQKSKETLSLLTIPLPRLSPSNVKAKIMRLRVQDASEDGFRRISRTLEWLWDVIAEPVLSELGFRQPPERSDWPRLWWVPCGRLSQLPIHAAGYHFDGSRRTVLDRVVSSYSSSIKTIIYGYRSRHFNEPVSQNVLVVVGMETTPSLPLSPLLFVKNEVALLDQCFQRRGIEIVKPPRQRKDVLASLKSCTTFHFAGHGRSDVTDPSRSALILEDGPLTVEDLRNNRSRGDRPFLAYLSACSTSSNKNDKLADEAIHLVSACQMVGFRHVIGTLWEVADDCCADVAGTVYETIFSGKTITDSKVSLGLHKAVRDLRDKKIGNTERRRNTKGELIVDSAMNETGRFLWVPYVHFGV
jgi:tetratricopeptide (TPR) repeat protein